MRTHDATNYTEQRYDFLRQVEGYNPAAYVDSAGIPTIGVGFNLRAHQNLLFLALGFDIYGTLSGDVGTDEKEYIRRITEALRFDYAANDTAALQAALQPIMDERSANPSYPPGFDRRPSFSFSNEDEARSVLNDLMVGYAILGQTWEGYEPLLNRWLARNSIPAIGESRERIALISLAYNGKDENGDGVSDLLGDHLAAALRNDDRAEVWYEIRYNSNKNSLAATPPKDAPGIANRRYRESDLFGLYNEGPLTEADAKAAYRTLTRHRGKILGADGVLGGSDGYEDKYPPPEADLRLVAQLAPAHAFLIDRYITEPGLAVAITGDILVGENDGADGGTDTRYFRGTDADTLLGTALNDLILGESGNDRLDGGAGDDILIGGAGVDTYVVQGHDILIDSGRNWIVYNGQLIAGVFTDDGSGSTFVADDGRTLTFSSPGQLTLSPTDSVTYQNQTGAADFAGHAFGIYLRAAAPTPVPGPTTAGDGDNNDLAGTTGADWITGNGGRDLIQGRAGADVLFADALADIPAGPGYGGATPYADAVGDFVIGGADNDILVGSTLSDALLSGTGGDFIVAGAGHDIVYGDCTYVPSSGNGGHLNLSSDGHQTARTHVAP